MLMETSDPVEKAERGSAGRGPYALNPVRSRPYS